MKIDKSKLPCGIWYEDENGNIIPRGEGGEPPKNAKSRHVCFPLEVREEVWFKESERTDGRPDITWSSHIGGGNQDVILAMANSGDYTLSEAMALYASCCERCMNVLAYKYLDGKDGYAEYSDEWKDCNTVCRYCKEVTADIEADKGVLEKINEKQNSLRATCKAWEEAISRDGYVN